MEEITGTRGPSTNASLSRTISTWTAEQWVAELRRKLNRSEEAQLELDRRAVA